MGTSNSTDFLLKEILSRMNKGASGSLNKTGKTTLRSNSQCGSGSDQNSSDCSDNQLTPPQVLVIIGILCGELDVVSVLFDKDQNVDILLRGSLKQKTQLDLLVDQLGAQPFDDVLKAIVGRLL